MSGALGGAAALPGLLLACCLLAWWLTSTAARLDRLHHRVETSRAALDAELARRASAAVEVATSGLLDPASALVVAGAAAASLDAPVGAWTAGPSPERADEERWQLETELSRALRAALPPLGAGAHPDDAERVERLLGAVRRVELARRFHNDAVTSARRLRAKRVVRVARLAGRAPLPRTADFDDAADLPRRAWGPAGPGATPHHRPPAGS